MMLLVSCLNKGNNCKDGKFVIYHEETTNEYKAKTDPIQDYPSKVPPKIITHVKKDKLTLTANMVKRKLFILQSLA
jgi:hypothetical protein